MTATRGPGRPREPHVPTELGVCEVHGNVEFRLHKNGKRADGTHRHIRRCPACHNEKNQAQDWYVGAHA